MGRGSFLVVKVWEFSIIEEGNLEEERYDFYLIKIFLWFFGFRELLVRMVLIVMMEYVFDN